MDMRSGSTHDAMLLDACQHATATAESGLHKCSLPYFEKNIHTLTTTGRQKSRLETLYGKTIYITQLAGTALKQYSWTEGNTWRTGVEREVDFFNKWSAESHFDYVSVNTSLIPAPSTQHTARHSQKPKPPTKHRR